MSGLQKVEVKSTLTQKDMAQSIKAAKDSKSLGVLMLFSTNGIWGS